MLNKQKIYLGSFGIRVDYDNMVEGFMTGITSLLVRNSANTKNKLHLF